MSAIAITRVELAGVCKRFGNVRALMPLSAQFDAGDVVGVVGENGAGKSTLLGLLAGLARSDAGELRYWAGSTRLSPSAARGAVGLVAHASLLYAELSAIENVRFFLRLYGQPASDTTCEALLTRVGLHGEAWHRPVATYSRGMTQRASLARALAHGPSLVILDEPFAGLDKAGAALLIDIVGELRAHGAIVVVVSHDTAPLAAVATRIIALHRGRLVASLPASCTQAQIDELYLARAPQELAS